MNLILFHRKVKEDVEYVMQNDLKIIETGRNMTNPKLKAVVTQSGTIPGKFSLRGVKDGKQIAIQLLLDEAGFVPGDIVELSLWEDKRDIVKELEEKVEYLQMDNQSLREAIDSAIDHLENG